MEDEDPYACETSLTITHDLVHVQYRGKITADELIAATEALHADPLYEPGMPVLIDLREASLANLDSSGLKRVGEHGAKMARGWGRHYAAIVAPNDREFGMSRQFEVLGARPGRELKVFRDFDAGWRWLQENRSTP